MFSSRQNRFLSRISEKRDRVFFSRTHPHSENKPYICRHTKKISPMDDVIKLDKIAQYNELFGLETFHPLVAVVDLKNATHYPTRFTINYGLYALFLKDVKCGDIRYGKQTYDYQEGTVVSFAPGQVTETELLPDVKPQARGLLFHPDFIKGTSLGREIKQYTFFSYASTPRLIPSWHGLSTGTRAGWSSAISNCCSIIACASTTGNSLPAQPSTKMC